MDDRPTVVEPAECGHVFPFVRIARIHPRSTPVVNSHGPYTALSHSGLDKPANSGSPFE